MKRIICTAVVVSFLWVNMVGAQTRKVYTPVSRPHTWKEKIMDFSIMYVVLWAGYAATQPDVVAKIQFKDFYENVFEKGAVLWDGDEYYWNFIAHPYVGSEYYLYFRSRGYAPKWAFVNSAITSTIFELFVETFSEPFSVNDFVITPVVGSSIGWLRERAGLKLVNSDRKFNRFLGHILYLETNLWFFEDVEVLPIALTNNGATGILLLAKF